MAAFNTSFWSSLRKYYYGVRRRVANCVINLWSRLNFSCPSRSLTEDTSPVRENETTSNLNGNSLTPTSGVQPDFSGTRSLSLRGSRSLLPISPSVEDPDSGTSRLDQEQGKWFFDYVTRDVVVTGSLICVWITKKLLNRFYAVQITFWICMEHWGITLGFTELWADLMPPV